MSQSKLLIFSSKSHGKPVVTRIFSHLVANSSFCTSVVTQLAMSLQHSTKIQMSKSKMPEWALVQNEELATRWLKFLLTIGFPSDLLLNMSNFDWPNYKKLKLTNNLVTS